LEHDRPAHFVVVGGGTAGWLAAFVLRDAAARRGFAAKVTVIESSKIPTIGVGEGTTAVFRILLKLFGIDEMEFLRETEATIKFGIRHRDWRKIGQHYDAPIDDPHQVVEAPRGAPSEFLNVYAVAAGRPLADMHLFGPLMARQRSPYARRADGSLIPLGPFHCAYHFDQALVGKFLRSKSNGVGVVDATVEAVDRNAETGAIFALKLDSGERLEGDFFIDATGFRRRLIGEALGGRWISYADALPVNRAMPFWLDIAPNEEIANYTLAHAWDAGWLWQIPTQRRYGCGYVYSDAFLTREEAQREIEVKLGRRIEVRGDIRFEVGRLAEPWIANCLAIGLSSSFLEPLEATSIHGSVVQLMLFAQRYLKKPSAMTAVDREDYNRRFGRQVDDFRTFINAPYLGGRDDTPFWRDFAANKVHDETRQRLDLWRRQMPRREHFPAFLDGLPHVESQLYYPVLDGLGLLDRTLAREEMDREPKLRAFARQTYEDLRREYLAAAAKAIGHAEFLRIARGDAE
jgi:flavin-dependent dehydrogenase